MYQDLKARVSSHKHWYTPLASATVPRVKRAASFTSSWTTLDLERFWINVTPPSSLRRSTVSSVRINNNCISLQHSKGLRSEMRTSNIWLIRWWLTFDQPYLAFHRLNESSEEIVSANLGISSETSDIRAANADLSSSLRVKQGI